jgi:hypothetical protein
LLGIVSMGGWLADRADHPKCVAFAGYLASGLSRIGLLFAQSLTACTARSTASARRSGR